MQCVEFENRLNDVLDERGRPELDILLASHAHHCESCQHLLARYELVCEAATQLPTPELPANFAQRVVAVHLGQKAAQPKPRRATRFGWAAPLFALAAVLLFAVLPLLDGNRLSRTPGKNRAASGSGGSLAFGTHAVRPVSTPATKAATNALAKQPAPPVPTFAVVAEAPLDPTEQYAGLAKETGYNLAVAVRQLPGMGGGLATSDLAGGEATGANVAFEQPGWVGQVSDGLRPVTSSMSDALHVLMRAIPSGSGLPQDRAS